MWKRFKLWWLQLWCFHAEYPYGKSGFKCCKCQKVWKYLDRGF